MNPNGLGTICAFAALGAFWLSHRFGLSVSPRRRLVLASVAAVLSVPAASFAAHYAHVLPETAGYYEFRSWHGTECLLVIPGFAGGMVASMLPRRRLALPLFASAALAFVPILKPFIRPIDPATMRDEWKDGVCLQSTPSTCGAASTATVLASLGVRAREVELAREAHSYAGGTEAWYLARAARVRGCEARFRIVSGFDPDIPFPAVVGVRLESYGHFIAILSRDGDRFHVADPLTGSESLSREELLGRYAFTGFYLCLRKGVPDAISASAPPPP